MQNKPKITDANVFFFVFTGIFLTFQFILGIIISILAVNYGMDYYQNFLFDHIREITLINEFVIILIPVLIFTASKKLKFKEVFRINNPGFLPMLLVLLGAIPAYLVALMLNNVFAFLIQLLGEIPSSPIPAPTNLQEILMSLFVFAVAPGICEELMHRGVMLSAYERRGSYRAIVYTAVLFGIFHFDMFNLLGPIFLGVLIGYYVLRTNSIFAGIFAHFLNNAIAVMLSYVGTKLPAEETATRITVEQLILLIVYGIIGLALLSGVIMLFNKATKKRFKLNAPLTSVKDDLSAVMSHWPIIAVTALYVLLNLITLYAIATSTL